MPLWNWTHDGIELKTRGGAWSNSLASFWFAGWRHFPPVPPLSTNNDDPLVHLTLRVHLRFNVMASWVTHWLMCSLHSAIARCMLCMWASRYGMWRNEDSNWDIMICRWWWRLKRFKLQIASRLDPMLICHGLDSLEKLALSTCSDWYWSISLLFSLKRLPDHLHCQV